MTETASRTIGYLRVSKLDQDLDKNRADILTLANREDLGRVEFIEGNGFRKDFMAQAQDRAGSE